MVPNRCVPRSQNLLQKKVVLRVSTPEETVNLVVSPITSRIHMSRACSCFGRELFQRHKAYMEYTTPQRFHVCSVYWWQEYNVRFGFLIIGFFCSLYYHPLVNLISPFVVDFVYLCSYRSFVGNIGKIRIYCNSVLLWSLWLIVLPSTSQLISLFFCSFHNYRPAMSAVSCHSKLWIPLSRCITRTTRSIATCPRWMHRRWKFNTKSNSSYVNIAPAGRSLNFFLQLFSSLRYAGYLLRELGLLAKLTWISKGKPRPPELAIGSYVNSTPSRSARFVFRSIHYELIMTGGKKRWTAER